MSSTSRIDTEGSFNTNPSGQEMLVSQAEKPMVEYHGKVAKDEELPHLLQKKEMIYAAEDQMIMKLEEGSLTKESIRSMFKEMHQHLLMIEMKESMKMAEATSAVAEEAAEAFRDAGGFEAAHEAFRDAFRD